MYNIITCVSYRPSMKASDRGISINESTDDEEEEEEDTVYECPGLAPVSSDVELHTKYYRQ